MVKVVKKIDGEKVSYVLRCLWHILNDPKSDHMMKWHPELDNAFIVADEEKLIEYFKTYKDFKTSFLSFRRSLYLYGFKKTRNIWTNAYINKNDVESLKRVIRHKKLNKKNKLQAKLAKHFPQFLLMQNQMMMHQQRAAMAGHPAMPSQHSFFGMPQPSPIPANGFFPSESAPNSQKIEKDMSGRHVILSGGSYNTLPLPPHLQIPSQIPRLPSPLNPMDALSGFMMPANLPTPTSEQLKEE